MEEKEKEEKKTVEEFRACSSLACSCSPSPSRAPCARSTFPFRQSATCPAGPRGAEEPGRRRGAGRGGEGREGRDISLSPSLSLSRGREFGEARGQRSKKVEFDRPASMLRRASARVQIIFAELVSIRHVALEDACRQAGSRRARAPRRGPEPRGRDDGDAFGHRRRIFSLGRRTKLATLSKDSNVARTWSRDAARTATVRRATRGTEMVARPARASAAGRKVTAAERAIVICLESCEKRESQGE